MSVDIMIDLETMGSGPDAAIVSIGACAMSVERGIYSQFYSPVSLKSSVEHGGRIDADTVLWWMRQSDAARHQLANEERTPDHILTALVDLSNWMAELAAKVNDRRVWGNGADFDLPILASAYRGIGETAPWPYFGSRCFRTLKNLHRQIPAPARQGTHHHALDDAVHQAEHWLAIMRAGARWYVLAADGRATLCKDSVDAEAAAKEYDMAWPSAAPHRAVQLVEAPTP